jgi:signal transduction histidine kinase
VARHSLLERQIRRHLAGIDVSQEPWRSFLDGVDEAYRGFDVDRELAEQAMQISSSELLDANAELQAILQAFPDPVLHLNADGVVVAVRGSSGRSLAGFEGVRDLDLMSALPADVAQALRDALTSAIMERKGARLEFVLSRGGDHVTYEMRLAPLALAEPGAIVLLRDITEQRLLDRLRLDRDVAEAASRAKSAFLATMSHELRTPLNAIVGYSEILAEDASAAGLAGMLDDLARITQAGRHLAAVVSGVLDIAKIEAGQMTTQLEVCDPAEIVALAVDSVAPQAQRNGNELVSLIEPGLSEIETDPDKLRQILINLLGNASKFTHHGRVSIVARRELVDAVFEVTDTGIGIPEDQIGRLFQDFVQLDDSITRRYGGTGLGLAICRRLCGLLRGTITVESALGQGSTFCVRLPLRMRADEAPTQSVGASATARQ